MKALIHFFLLLLTLELIHLCVNAIPVHSQCSEHQKLSLLQLKESLVFDNYASKLISWNSNTDCCSWVGVTCIEGRVVGLDISKQSLSGVFSKKIFQVPTLQTVDLSDNPQLHGSLPEFPKNASLLSLDLSFTKFSELLPDSIGDLKMLSRLDLHNCNFSGPIPESIANLTKLVYLDLSRNKFNGSVPLLRGSKNLTDINLSLNVLKGQINYTHWESLMNLVNLNLSYNQLEGNIPSTLFSLPQLMNLHLDNNQFYGQLDEFSNVFLYSLKKLDLSSNNLEGPIPMSFLNLRGLESLSLSSNNFNGSFLLNGLQQLSNLSDLDLSFNSLAIDYNDTDSSLSSFPQMYTLKLASGKLRRFPGFLRNQYKLKSLDLSQNQIHGEIPNWIWRLNKLAQLNLSYNSLVNLQGPFPNLTSMEILDLHSNQLQGQIPFIPPYVVYLDYSSNNLSSTIPADIGDFLSFTVFFSLSRNQFHGIIPESLCNAAYLRVLDLSSNSLIGLIPQCLTEMSLAVLNLRRNNLSGTIPDMFPQICSLVTLDLSGNHIEGQFPKSLEKCTMLEVLNLGNNQILDTFPLLLKNTKNLHVLVLRSNQFYGCIGCSETNGTWSKLQILDIAHNNFICEIPGPCLKTWRAMMVEENDVQSKIKNIQFTFPGFPKDDVQSMIKTHPFKLKGFPEFVEMSTLQLDYATVDKGQVVRVGLPLQLAVPKIEKNQSKGLRFTYLDAVTVTNKGQEMVLTKILTIFTSIDISNNSFNGSIPEEMGELISLKALNLSSNAFTGAIPSSLCNLRQLESLDIANNKLEGTIPQEFAKLNFLSFLNISNNQLEGMIPKSTQISTFPASYFAGNKGLYGPPLTGDNTSEMLTSNGSHSNSSHGIDRLNPWIGIEIGFVVGLWFSIGSLVFCKRWSKWYYRAMYNILLKIFPRLDERIGHHRRHVYINQRWKRNTS